LGLGDTTNRSEFSLVSGILVGVNIVKLSTAGGTRSGNSTYYRHSVQALSADGRIFNWGYGGNHELGRGDTNSSSVPLELPTADFDGQVVDVISSRGSWTSYIAITDANKAYGWGGNEYGCLGVGHTEDVNTPTLLTLTNADGTENTSGIKKIFFGAGSGTYGYHHNVLIVTNDMKLFSAGYGGQGQTGQNNTTSYSTFQQIRFDMVDRIVQVSTGGYSSTWAWYILLDDGRVFGWGDNDYQQVQINQSYGYRALPTLTIQ
jgi:alpha-tubulin suppressor-like RCC1 family protein